MFYLFSKPFGLTLFCQVIAFFFFFGRNGEQCLTYKVAFVKFLHSLFEWFYLPTSISAFNSKVEESLCELSPGSVWQPEILQVGLNY